MEKELAFHQMIKELIESDFLNVSPPGALITLDLVIHENKVYDLKGPVAIHTAYFNDNHQLFNYKIDEIITSKIRFVQKELKKSEIIKKAIIISNLDQQIVEDYTSLNELPEGIFLWGSKNLRQLLTRHKNILSKYNHDFFINKISEEIKYLARDIDRRNEEINYNNGKFLGKLKQSLVFGNLVLTLGAGVSLSANIPNWKDLVSKIYFHALEDKGIRVNDISIEPFTYWQLTEEFGNTNLLIRTRYAKQLLGNKFLNVVQEWLYNESQVSSFLLESIAELCNFRISNRINSIITYNFDDLVEKQLETLKIDHTPIWRGDQIVKPNSIPIYHVHGFVPRDFSPLDEIVFSEDDYHNQYTNLYSWANIIQLNNFREKTCLFIGLSLSDPNIRRLLDVSRTNFKFNQHYIITKRIYSETNIKKIINNYKQIKELTTNLANNHFLKEKYKILEINEETLRSIMLTEELLIEKDFNSLGLNVLWVNEHDEIPMILGKLRS